MGTLTAERAVRGLHDPEMAVTVRVYVNSDIDPRGYVLTLDHKGFEMSIQTKRQGLRAIKAAIDEALQADG